MSNVILFPQHRTRPAGAQPRALGETADILLFLGVRYERHEDQGPRRPAPAAGTLRVRKSRRRA